MSNKEVKPVEQLAEESVIDWEGLEKEFEDFIRKRYPINDTYTKDGEDSQYNLRASGFNSLSWLKNNLTKHIK